MNFHERTEEAMATIAAMDALLRDTAGGLPTTSAAQALLAQGKLDDLQALLADLFDAADSVRANVPLPDDSWRAVQAWLLIPSWDGREAHYYLADQHRLATGGS